MDYFELKRRRLEEGYLLEKKRIEEDVVTKLREVKKTKRMKEMKNDDEGWGKTAGEG